MRGRLRSNILFLFTKREFARKPDFDATQDNLTLLKATTTKAQSDQRLCYSQFGYYSSQNCSIQYSN